MIDSRSEAFLRLLDIMDELRVKCPWDREQTFESLRNNTIEESYELLDAIIEGDLTKVKEELGDLMLHIVFYSKMGEEEGAFTITDVLNSICEKLVYRHPHIFGDVIAESVSAVRQNWESLKLNEKGRKKGVLSGVPKTLPAMVKAYRMGEKAASAGFDWEDKSDVWEKVKEEIAEIEVEMVSNNKVLLEEEFGDLIFALINAARLNGIDPESALERCNKKFIHRFEHIEKRVEEQNKSIKDCDLDELETYWCEAKIK